MSTCGEETTYKQHNCVLVIAGKRSLLHMNTWYQGEHTGAGQRDTAADEQFQVLNKESPHDY